MIIARNDGRDANPHEGGEHPTFPENTMKVRTIWSVEIDLLRRFASSLNKTSAEITSPLGGIITLW